MKYAFIKTHSHHYSVSALCFFLQVSRSGYYHWLKRKPSQRALKDLELKQQIREIHHGSHESYGTLRVWKQLSRESVNCGRDRVARLRREAGLQTKRRKRFVVTTRSSYTSPVVPNLLNREFNVKEPNRAWVGDVTFIATREGWLYLAVILDLYSRKVIGWSMSERNNVELVTNALQMAIDGRKPEKGLIHHSDRGNLYTAHSYRNLQAEHGMISSMSRKGDCFDNAVAESFFASLKNEWTFYKHYSTRREARTDIFKYIEVFYNRKRLHQTLGYQTPVQKELNAA